MEESAPTVSIGLPVYNGEQFVAEAIASILSQSFRDLELLIQDNASDDTTAEICKKYAAEDSRVSYVRNPENLGGAANFNLTVDRARGRYFKWVSHDDVCGPEFLASCVAALDANPKAVLAYPTPFDIDENGSVLGTQDTGLGLDSGGPNERFEAAMGQVHGCLPVFGLMRTDILRKTARLSTYPSSDRVLIAELTLWGELTEVEENLQFLHREHRDRGFMAYSDTADRTSWWNPKSARAVAMVLWQELGAYATAVHRPPLTGRQRLRAHATVAGWAIRNWRNLGGEVKAWLIHHLRRPSRRHE